MNKVYFDSTKKRWFVNEPEDIYSFKSVNSITNEIKNQILSWTRNFDLEDYPNHIRMYDVEIDKIKYFFLMSRSENHYLIEPENPQSLEKLLEENNIFFVGETLK